MKKILLLSGITAIVFTSACNNNANKEDAHQHEDGSTHVHADTVKPAQQEFQVTDTLKKDTTAHTHKDGGKHSH